MLLGLLIKIRILKTQAQCGGSHAPSPPLPTYDLKHLEKDERLKPFKYREEMSQRPIFADESPGSYPQGYAPERLIYTRWFS